MENKEFDLLMRACSLSKQRSITFAYLEQIARNKERGINRQPKRWEDETIAEKLKQTSGSLQFYVFVTFSVTTQNGNDYITNDWTLGLVRQKLAARKLQSISRGHFVANLEVKLDGEFVVCIHYQNVAMFSMLLVSLKNRNGAFLSLSIIFVLLFFFLLPVYAKLRRKHPFLLRRWLPSFCFQPMCLISRMKEKKPRKLGT